MISATIKTRTQGVNKQIKESWCQQWMDYVERHPEHPWDWSGISWNGFEKEKKTFTEKKYKEHLSVLKIQHWYRKIAENPHHKSGICKRRVYATYDKLFNIVENE